MPQPATDPALRLHKPPPRSPERLQHLFFDPVAQAHNIAAPHARALALQQGGAQVYGLFCGEGGNFALKLLTQRAKAFQRLPLYLFVHALEIAVRLKLQPVQPLHILRNAHMRIRKAIVYDCDGGEGFAPSSSFLAAAAPLSAAAISVEPSSPRTWPLMPLSINFEICAIISGRPEQAKSIWLTRSGGKARGPEI